MMTMQQAYVLVVSVVLGLCKLYIILNRMVKAAQLRLGGFLCVKNGSLWLIGQKVCVKTLITLDIY